MAITQVTVNMAPKLPDGGQARGRYVFTLSAPITDGAGLRVLPLPRLAVLGPAGTAQIVLYATDDATTAPAGQTYLVDEWLTDASGTQPEIHTSWSIALPHAVSPVALETLAPVQPGPQNFSYALAAGLTAETARATAAEALRATTAALTAETTRATGAEALAATAAALTTETTRATGAEGTELTRATASEALKATIVALTAETTRATGAEALLVNRAGDTMTGALAVQAGGASLQAGPGATLPRGAPTFTPTVVSGGAGALTGAYKYAYTERDLTGETTLSPASLVFNAAAQQMLVTFGLSRRGAVGRNLYRTKAGGSTYYLVPVPFPGGTDYFQTTYLDNTADGALGAQAPTVDTSGAVSFRANTSVKYFTSGPDQGAGPADLTILTSDGISAGELGIDCYAPILARSVAGTTFASEKVLNAAGSNQATIGYHFRALVAAESIGSVDVEVFRMEAHGATFITPDTNSTTSLLSILPTAAQTNQPLVKITNPAGGNQPCLQIDNAGGQGINIAPSAAFTGPTGAVRITLPATSTGVALWIDSQSAGDMIRDRNNAFRVLASGALNLNGLGATMSYIPSLTVGTSLLHTGSLGFYGHAGVAQPAAPVTLADVIAIIRGCGLSA